MPIKPPLDAPGVPQHVIARGIERGKIFSDDKDYQFFKDRLGKLILETQMECFAWVLLPENIMGRAFGKCSEMGWPFPSRFSVQEQTFGSGPGSRCSFLHRCSYDENEDHDSC